MIEKLHEAGDPEKHDVHLVIWPQDIQFDHGGALWIRIPGFKGNPEDPDECNLMIEYYEGKLQIHFCNREDSNASRLEMPASEPVQKAIESERDDLPLLLADADEQAREIIEERMKNGCCTYRRQRM